MGAAMAVLNEPEPGLDENNESHVRQMIGYPAITRLELALRFYFKRAKLEWKRVVRENI